MVSSQVSLKTGIFFQNQWSTVLARKEGKITKKIWFADLFRKNSRMKYFDSSPYVPANEGNMGLKILTENDFQTIRGIYGKEKMIPL